MLAHVRAEAASCHRVENSGVLQSSVALVLSVNTLSREYLFCLQVYIMGENRNRVQLS